MPLSITAAYLGLLAAFLIISAAALCYRRCRIDFRRQTLSFWGDHPQTASIFSRGLIAFSILQSLFFYSVLAILFPSLKNTLGFIPLFASVSAVGLAVFNSLSHPRLHLLFAVISLSLLALWNVIFPYIFLWFHQPLISLAFTLSPILSALGIITSVRYGICAVPELVFVIGLISWNLLFVFLLS
jgi:hypothetical protein